MPDNKAQLDLPPGPGEKRSFVPGGPVNRIKPPRDPYPTQNKAEKIADKLRALQKQQEQQQKEQEDAREKKISEIESKFTGEKPAEDEKQAKTEPGGEVGKSVSDEEPKDPKDAAEKADGASHEERKSESAPDPVSKDKDLSAQFSALARAEKRLREEAHAQKEELEKQRQELQHLAELKTIADKDKYQLLDHLGVDINEWAKRKLGKADADVEEATKNSDILKRLEAVEAKNRELEEQRQQLLAYQNYEQQKKIAVAEIDNLLQNDSDRYEYTRIRGGAEVVFATIEEHYAKTGQVLDFADAADRAEAYFEQEANLYSKASKFKPKKSSDEGVTKPEKPAQEDKTGPKTVTHAPDRLASPARSKRERLERAAAILRAGQQE